MAFSIIILARMFSLSFSCCCCCCCSSSSSSSSSSYYYYYYYYYCLLIRDFSHQCKLNIFHRRLSDSKSPQVPRTLLSILAVFNYAAVWMVSSQPPTSKSSRPFNNPLVTVLKAPVTISIIVTFIFHSFFNSLTRSRYLSLFTFFQFYSVVNSFRVFHISVSWCSFTEVWVTTSLLKSPGLFSVF